MCEIARSGGCECPASSPFLWWRNLRPSIFSRLPEFSPTGDQRSTGAAAKLEERRASGNDAFFRLGGGAEEERIRLYRSHIKEKAA